MARRKKPRMKVEELPCRRCGNAHTVITNPDVEQSELHGICDQCITAKERAEAMHKNTFNPFNK